MASSLLAADWFYCQTAVVVKPPHPYPYPSCNEANWPWQAPEAGVLEGPGAWLQSSLLLNQGCGHTGASAWLQHPYLVPAIDVCLV